MKNLSMFMILVFIVSTGSFAQDNNQEHFPMLGETAPSFVAETTQGKLHFPDDYFNKWKILFSHPADFTAVCSSEIIALATMQDDFEKLNTKIAVLSTDGLNSHIEWCHSLESMQLPGFPQVKIGFPLIPDVDLSISRMYGMIHKYTNTTKDVRGVFIIDPDNKVAAIFYYPSSVGRNLEEIMRTLIALQTAEKYSVLTPVNWKAGEDVMLQSPKSREESVKLEKKSGDGSYYKADWYIWYKKLPENIER
jgi:peroxiredoxin (alkyl hydroperoxide reductase subunit C)